jgi:hypothetical protein
MKKLLSLVALGACLSFGAAQAQDKAPAPVVVPGCHRACRSTRHAGATCDAKAIDKNGKPLAGAAKASSIKKCERKTPRPPSSPRMRRQGHRQERQAAGRRRQEQLREEVRKRRQGLKPAPF